MTSRGRRTLYLVRDPWHHPLQVAAQAAQMAAEGGAAGGLTSEELAAAAAEAGELVVQKAARKRRKYAGQSLYYLARVRVAIGGVDGHGLRAGGGAGALCIACGWHRLPPTRLSKGAHRAHGTSPLPPPRRLPRTSQPAQQLLGEFLDRLVGGGPRVSGLGRAGRRELDRAARCAGTG